MRVLCSVVPSKIWVVKIRTPFLFFFTFSKWKVKPHWSLEDQLLKLGLLVHSRLGEWFYNILALDIVETEGPIHVAAATEKCTLSSFNAGSNSAIITFGGE